MAAVLPASAAETADITPGDVITAIDGTDVGNAGRGTFLLQSSTGANRRLSVIRVEGTARAIDVQMGRQKNSLDRYLRRDLAEGSNPATGYLYASEIAEPTAALGIIEQMLKNRQDFAPLHALRAQKLIQTAGRPPVPPDRASAAAAAVVHAIALDPMSAELRSTAAEVYMALDRPQLAELEALAALARDPELATGHRLLGLARLALRQPEAALPELRRAVELAPYDAGPYEELALNYRILGQTDSAEATLAAQQALRSPSTAQAGWGPKAWAVLWAVSLSSFVTVIPMLLWQRRYGSPPAVRANEDATSRTIGVVEVLGALGGWAAVLPIISPGFGLAPESTLRLEIADHVIPGIVILLASFTCLFSLLRGANSDVILVLPVLTFLCGFWITATHFPLVVQAAQHIKPWSLALFHSSAGPPILIVSIWLYLLLSGAKGEAVPLPSPTSSTRGAGDRVPKEP